MKNLKSFKRFNDVQSQNYLAQAMPKGKLTANRFDSTSWMYKLLLCLAMPIKIITGLVEDLAKNVNIDKADELLEDWEASVKIPTETFRLDIIEDRREAIKRKISKYPISHLKNYTTFDDYATYEEYIKLLTGIDIEIVRGSEGATSYAFPLKFPIKFGAQTGRLNLLFFIQIKVVYEIPKSWKEIIDKELSRVFPVFCGWGYQEVKIMLGLSNLINVISNGTDTDHDIVISPDIKMMDSTDTSLLTSVLGTIEIDAEFGTGNGGMYVGGSVAVDTTYHIFMIRKDADNSIAYYFDTSLTAANIPTGYTKFIRLWSVITDGSANIINFYQYGKYCQWNAKIQDSTDTFSDNNRKTYTLSTPLGIISTATITFDVLLANASAFAYFKIESLTETDAAVTNANYDFVPAIDGNSEAIGGIVKEVETDTSSQICARTSDYEGGVSGAWTVSLMTNGYEDITLQ